jgi:hypothetical protein
MNDKDGASHRSIARVVLKEAAWIGVAVALALLFLFPAMSLLFRGWGDIGLTNGIYAQNRTDYDLKFRMQLETGWYTVPGIAEPYVGSYASNLLVAGPSTLDRNGCTTGPIVALDESGREVARRAAPVCLGEDGQELWVIGGPAASPSG